MAAPAAPREGRSRRLPPVLSYAAAILLAFLGMKTKEFCVTLPVAFLAYRFLLFPRTPGRSAWRDALPIPIPADRVNWRDVTIAGGPALLLTDSMGLGSAAIWQRGDRVYGVFGSVAADDLERVANSLR